MAETIHVLRGGNMDIDLIPMPILDWERNECPWNKAEGSGEHRCAVKSTSICRYFRGIQPLDTVLCAFPSTETTE